MKRLLIAVLLGSLAGCGGQDSPPPPAPAGAAAAGPAFLAAAGESNPLPDGGWFTWQFAEKPKLGTLIVRVRAFDKAGSQVRTYEITGESGMPSMRAHDSGAVKFQLNKKGDYLLPVDVVMPGEWEVLLRIKKEKKEIYAGKVLFNI